MANIIAGTAQLPDIWLRPRIADRSALAGPISPADIDDAAARLARFRPALVGAFAAQGWDGRIRSELLDYAAPGEAPALLLKGDHDLPLTGSIKARGGIYELLVLIERLGREAGLLTEATGYEVLLSEPARAVLARHTVVVASTGNLGFSIGLAARAFGLGAQIHMSYDAKSWKKERLRRIGATVVEHDCDYTQTVARARAAAEASDTAYFVDDETSRLLMLGYATAGRELAEQLDARGIAPTQDKPLVVYLPCGVGGAPAGITYGLKTIYGEAVVAIFVEPHASPCMLAALATGAVAEPPAVYAFGRDNRTIADGLAVPRASALALETVGAAIDGAIALPDSEMLDWVGRAWRERGLRLEPSAAAALAAVPRLLAAALPEGWPDLQAATHIAWATGGGLLPDDEFERLLGAP